MTTLDGLLQAVLAEPDADGPRLVFADWCEENGEPERAEFVRVQCKLAAYSPRSAAVLYHKQQEERGAKCETICCGFCALRRRESELLQRHYPDWLPHVMEGWQVIGGPDSDGWCVVPPWQGVRFRRGFASEVRCRMADWYGGKCRRCEGRGWLTHPLALLQMNACPACVNGRTQGHGPALVKACPLEVVRVDREPLQSGSFWSWWEDDGNRSDYHTQSNLPVDVWNLLGGYDTDRESSPSSRYYFSRQAALDALSTALIRWAKDANRTPHRRRQGIDFSIPTTPTIMVV